MRDISLGQLTELEKINQVLEDTSQDYAHI
jgi:hypothetical protein